MKGYNKLVSDNGRPFISSNFQNFLKANGTFNKCVRHHKPGRNELAERTSRTFYTDFQTLRKLHIANLNIKDSLQKFLFHYKLTPHQELGKSPAEMMFGRKLKCRLDLLFPKTDANEKGKNVKYRILKVFVLARKLRLKYI